VAGEERVIRGLTDVVGLVVTNARDMSQADGSRSIRSPLASGSVREHLLRGAAGLIAVVAAIVLAARVGPVSLALLPVAALAWRGCPTCWTVGLLGTLADGRGRRGGCTVEGRCRHAGRDAGFQAKG
jgi:hypothetical protein